VSQEHQPPTPEMTEPARPSPDYDRGEDTNIGVIVIVGVFFATGFFLIIVLVQAWFYDWQGSAAAAKTVPPGDPRTALGRMLVEQREQINSYRWVNREAGVRAIPIDRAMQRVAAEMAAVQRGNPPEVKHGKRNSD
jgi:hypothetical protein